MGSVSLLIKIIDILHVSPNYIFNGIFPEFTNKKLELMDGNILETYSKLCVENKKYIDQSILHLYNMQKNVKYNQIKN